MAEAEAETAALSRLTPSVLRFSRFLLILPLLLESAGGTRAAEGVAEREAAADEGPFEERMGEEDDDEDVTTVVAGWLE